MTLNQFIRPKLHRQQKGGKHHFCEGFAPYENRYMELINLTRYLPSCHQTSTPIQQHQGEVTTSQLLQLQRTEQEQPQWLPPQELPMADIASSGLDLQTIAMPSLMREDSMLSRISSTSWKLIFGTWLRASPYTHQQPIESYWVCGASKGLLP